MEAYLSGNQSISRTQKPIQVWFKIQIHSPKSSPGFRLCPKNGNKYAKEVDDKCGFSEHVCES